MGQQQLLLIVLGVIIVGIAVVVGINVFSASAVSSNRDAVSSDLLNLGSLAQQYYKKPLAMGGGGNSFVGWTVPTALASTGNGHYAISGTPTATTLTIVGTGTEKNGADSVSVSCAVTPTAVTNTVVH